MAGPTVGSQDPNLYSGLYLRSLAVPCPCPPEGEVPFGVPPIISVEGLEKRRAFAAKLLPQVTALLDTLQKAHREGLLTADEHIELARTEAWYTRLKAEVDAPPTRPPKKPRR